MNKPRINVLSVALAIWLTACGSGVGGNVVVVSDVPQPVMEKIPLDIGVVYDEQLAGFVATIDPRTGGDFDVDLKDSQKSVFHKVLNGLFHSVTELEAIDSSASDLDYVLQASIDDFSLLTPRDSGGDFFAISMRHFVDVYSANGENLDRIVVNSYGRQRKSGALMSNEDNVIRATDDAFRDLAVNTIVGLTEKFKQENIASDQADNAPDTVVE